MLFFLPKEGVAAFIKFSGVSVILERSRRIKIQCNSGLTFGRWMAPVWSLTVMGSGPAGSVWGVGYWGEGWGAPWWVNSPTPWQSSVLIVTVLFVMNASPIT